MAKKASAIIATIILLASLSIQATAAGFTGGYKIISSQSDLESIKNDVTRMLITEFGIAIRLPLTVKLVSGKELDALYNGAYRGAEIGLYKRVPSGHEIYIMTGMSQDEVTGTMAHEMTHAWQAEACVPNQDTVIKEGFACWVEYKVLDKIGAYNLANNIKMQADPVYGVGMKKMLEWEDKVGAKQLPIRIRKVVNVSSEI